MSLPSTWHIKLLLERHFFQCDMLNYYWSVTSFNVTCYIIGASLPLTWHVILERHFLQHDILYYWSVTSFNMSYYNIGVSLLFQQDILYYWRLTSFNLTYYIIGVSLPSTWHVILYWTATSLKETHYYYSRTLSTLNTRLNHIGKSPP